CHTKRRGGRLAIINFAPATVELLAQAFAPQLFEPERKFPELLRVRKEHQDSFSALAVEDELNEGSGQRRIFEEASTGLRSRLPRSIHQCFDIEPQKRSGQRPDRGKNAETAADVRGDL